MMKIFGILALTYVYLQVSAQSSGLQTVEEKECTCIPMAECHFDTKADSNRRTDENCETPFQICCTEDDIIQNSQTEMCGYRNPNGVYFEIINAGQESQFGEFPWMIEILFENINNIPYEPVYDYIGGGSLITPSTVLTAAHKISGINATQLNVRAGEWDRSTLYEPILHQDRKVFQVITHENFNVMHGFFGIGLLILEFPINLEKHINTICLPPRNFDFTGSKCFVTGWGADAQNVDNMIRKPVDILKKIDLPVVDDKECQDQLRKTRLGPRFYLHPSFMCAGGEKGKDACLGDGGSPLVCPVPNSVNKYYLAGIVIGGVDCGKENVPGLYIEVSKFIPWINKYIENYN